ncbi:hypothetical protein ACO2Q2_13855 [Dyella sp. KRB-257]|uniref:hypothetical protein n=1 Tax=Dyella sp. KRB-257 TaxID=3400915 RepID=UPI003BFCE8F2
MTPIPIGRNDATGASLDPRHGNRHGMIEVPGKSTVRTMGNRPGRRILCGVLGGIFGGRR